MSIIEQVIGKTLAELASWDLPLLRRVLPPPPLEAPQGPPPLSVVCFQYDDSKSPEENFVEVAKLCARGYAHIDLYGRHIRGLTLVFGSHVTLSNAVVDVLIPLTTYPGAQQVVLFGNHFRGPGDVDIGTYVLGPTIASV